MWVLPARQWSGQVRCGGLRTGISQAVYKEAGGSRVKGHPGWQWLRQPLTGTLSYLNLPIFLRWENISPPGTYSNTMYKLELSWKVEEIYTVSHGSLTTVGPRMFGCLGGLMWGRLWGYAVAVGVMWRCCDIPLEEERASFYAVVCTCTPPEYSGGGGILKRCSLTITIFQRLCF